jgi:hypothetical protein
MGASSRAASRAMPAAATTGRVSFGRVPNQSSARTGFWWVGDFGRGRCQSSLCHLSLRRRQPKNNTGRLPAERRMVTFQKRGGLARSEPACPGCGASPTYVKHQLLWPPLRPVPVGTPPRGLEQQQRRLPARPAAVCVGLEEGLLGVEQPPCRGAGGGGVGGFGARPLENEVGRDLERGLLCLNFGGKEAKVASGQVVSAVMRGALSGGLPNGRLKMEIEALLPLHATRAPMAGWGQWGATHRGWIGHAHFVSSGGLQVTQAIAAGWFFWGGREVVRDCSSEPTERGRSRGSCRGGAPRGQPRAVRGRPQAPGPGRRGGRIDARPARLPRARPPGKRTAWPGRPT